MPDPVKEIVKRTPQSLIGKEGESKDSIIRQYQLSEDQSEFSKYPYHAASEMRQSSREFGNKDYSKVSDKEALKDSNKTVKSSFAGHAGVINGLMQSARTLGIKSKTEFMANLPIIIKKSGQEQNITGAEAKKYWESSTGSKGGQSKADNLYETVSGIYEDKLSQEMSKPESKEMSKPESKETKTVVERKPDSAYIYMKDSKGNVSKQLK